jgi:hypothetical protein
VKLKTEHWWCIAFAIAAILIYLHATISVQDQVSIENETLSYAMAGAAAYA